MKIAKRSAFLQQLHARFPFHFDNRSSIDVLPAERDFRRWAWQAVKNEYRRAEISLILLDEDEARAYNRDYRQKDYATNVLSFALNEGESWLDTENEVLSGDLIICPQVVCAKRPNKAKLPTRILPTSPGTARGI